VAQRTLEAALGGDDEAFRALVEPHRGGLHAHRYRMLGSLRDAEDALQETLLRCWRGLARFDRARPLRPWLYRIATNVCINLLARRSRRVLSLDAPPASSRSWPRT
jgi:RNA polymerase sigma-70 factor (ECF subfamily)